MLPVAGSKYSYIIMEGKGIPEIYARTGIQEYTINLHDSRRDILGIRGEVFLRIIFQ